MDNYPSRSYPAATQTPIAQPSPIVVSAEHLDKKFAELQELVSALECRLSPVLREEPIARALKEGAPTGQSCFALMLYQCLRDAESVTERISSILSRLEV